LLVEAVSVVTQQSGDARQHASDVVSCESTPCRCETEQHPDGLALSVAERSPFFLFARMIVEMAFPIARKYKFDANVRRCSQLRSEYSDIEFRLIETLQPHFNKQS
jgi:hypothetical protein